MATDAERDAAMTKKKMEQMNAPYNAYRPPNAPQSPDIRVADALEYSAYQLGEIRRHLEELVRIGRGK